MTPDAPLSYSPGAAPQAVRQAVRQIPAYPFTPIDAPIKLDQNESPLDFPAELKAAAAERLLARPWNRYPDLHADTLRDRIAAYEGWDPEGVVVTPGSNVLIKLLTELAGIGQRVLTTQPTFSVYTLEARMLGAELTELPLRPDFSLPEEAFLEALEAAPGAGLLYLTQPHAPTGHADPPEVIARVAGRASELGWVTVVDEAYYQYAGHDYRDLVRALPGTLSLRTFSKAWALAGARAGYLLTQPGLAAEVQKLVSAFTMNALTQAVLEVALENPGYMQGRVAQALSERERVRAALNACPGCEALPSRSNFFLLRTPDAAATYRALLDQGVVVRRQDSLPMLGGCLRVSVGTPEQNDALIAAVRAFTGGALGQPG